jgi:hypothetical protein
MSDHYRQRGTIFATTMDDRLEWEHAAEHSRHLAVAADAELRCRHPEQPFEPLRSAESALVSDTDRAELTLTPDKLIADQRRRAEPVREAKSAPVPAALSPVPLWGPAVGSVWLCWDH